jgi:type I restriction-modification system DNA methylase subunit
MEQKKLFGGFKNYYEFLTHFFEIIGNNVGNQYYEDDSLGKVVVLGPAIFLNGNIDQAAITILDRWFYKEGMTDTLINTPPKKVGADVPLVNLFESRDWTEGNIDDFVLVAIYEKLITHIERKKLGAYYTPKEITEYICKNTIEPYLIDKVNCETGSDFKSIDTIVESDDKETLLHLFDSLKELKILDPAVGSAHFLADAIEVLLGVYEKIWDRAKELGLRRGLEITAADERGRLKNINLLEISDRDRGQFRIYIKFFIILSKNIYGVDINQSAINVARARLFLSIAKHFDVGKGCFIRFPNVHFNLRRGNSLIGYVEMGGGRGSEQSAFDMFVGEKEAVYAAEPIRVVFELGDYLSETARTLGMGGNILEEIRGLNGILSMERIKWNEFERVLRVKEKLIRILIASLNSEHAMLLNGLIKNITALFDGKLDERFAREYGIGVDALEEIGTFHWIMEFPEVFLERGGFDVVVGNPPYVELTEVGYDFLIPESRNLYDEFMKISIRMLLPNGRFGFIHANSAYCQPKYEVIRTFLKENTDDLTIINFAIRPQPVFKGVMQRTAITICRKDDNGTKRVKTSRYIRLTEENRNKILDDPPVYDSSRFAWKFSDFVPKIGNEFDYRIFKKLFDNNKSLEDILNRKSGFPLFYHDSGESYWTKALNYEPKGIRAGKEVRASQWFEIKVNSKYADFVLGLINSTLFYWFWLTISDCRHLTQEVIKRSPIPSDSAFSSEILEELKEASSKLMECYQKNSSYVEKRKGYKSLEFKVNRCKGLVNEIDRIMGEIYGLTDDEVDYLIKYDEEMRIGET